MGMVQRIGGGDFWRTQTYDVLTLIPVAISYLLEATQSSGMVLQASEEFSPPLPGLGCSAPIMFRCKFIVYFNKLVQLLFDQHVVICHLSQYSIHYS